MNKRVVIGGVISLLYITAIEYFYYYSLAQPNWRSQNTLAFLWPFTIFITIDQMKWQAGASVNKLFTLIGRASYHIYLSQMMYFWSISGIVRTLSGNFVFYTLVSITLCIISGIVFMNFETIMRKKFFVS